MATEAVRIEVDGKVLCGRLRRGDGNKAKPVIVAVHGGTYSGTYFDVPGFSLVDRAAAHGFDIVAMDRAAYGESSQLPDAEDLIQKNAEQLVKAMPQLLTKIGRDGDKVFLIGHSIGGATVVSMAAERPKWLAGIAISGCGLKTPPESAEAYANLPRQYMVELPAEAKDFLMFGPADTLGDGMPAASHIANTQVPLHELTDITGGWQQRLTSQAPKVSVPVHYRQGGHEKLWIIGQDQVDGFAALFTSSPRVDAKLVADAGHCIDFHKAGAKFQDEQLAFAARCVTQAA